MIKITELNKIYNQNQPNEVTALKNINCEFRDGEMVAVVGRSGAGKSTLLHIIGAIEPFESGSVRINSNELKGLRDKDLADFRNKNIGIVLQNFALIDSFTAFENIEIPLLIANISKKERNERIKTVLKEFGIANLAKRKISQLSGGEKQRVAIARAVVNNPKIVLADEPTGALDTSNKEIILNCFKEIKNQGKTVIIVTHDLNLAEECDRIIRIEDGKLYKDEQL